METKALDIYDYVNLKDYIRETKKPLFIEREDGQKVAIVLTREAKIFYQKREFQAFVLDELFEKLLSYETFEEQKSAVDSIFKVINTFQGQVM